MTLGEVNEAGAYIASQVDHRAMIFFGMVNGEPGSDVARVTLIATGISDDEEMSRFTDPSAFSSRFSANRSEAPDLELPPFLRRTIIR